MDEISHGPPGRGPRKRRWLVLPVVAALIALGAGLAGHGRLRHSAERPIALPSPSPTESPWRAAVVATTPISVRALTGLVISPQASWVADWGSGTLTRVDRRSRRVAVVLRLPPQQGPESIAYGGHALFVLDFWTSRVLRLDERSGAVTGRLSVARYGEPQHLAFGNRAVWLTSTGALHPGDRYEHLVKIDPVRLAVVAVAPIPGEGPGTVAAAGPQGIWVGCSGFPRITLLDPVSLRPVSSAPADPGQYAPQLAATGDAVWVLGEFGLVRVDPVTRAVQGAGLLDASLDAAVAHLAVDAGGRPWLATGTELRVRQPTGEWVVVAGTAGAQAVAVDGDTAAVLTRDALVELDARSLHPPAG